MSKSTNITWHEGAITRTNRAELLKNPNKVVWFTGLSGSGKSTIARELEQRLYDKGIACYVLDGDNVRHGLNSNLGFSAEDREENIRRIAEVCKLFYDAGITVIASFISPYKKDRNFARSLIGEDFIEVFVDTPLEVCEQRDPKGLYKKARAGEIKNFTGISAPYEAPENPEVICKTTQTTVEEGIVSILKKITTEY